MDETKCLGAETGTKATRLQALQAIPRPLDQFSPLVFRCPFVVSLYLLDLSGILPPEPGLTVLHRDWGSEDRSLRRSGSGGHWAVSPSVISRSDLACNSPCCTGDRTARSPRGTGLVVAGHRLRMTMSAREEAGESYPLYCDGTK